MKEIDIQGMTPAHLPQVAELSVATEQVEFVGTMEELLVNIDDKLHPHVILDGNTVVGFFLIDTQYGHRYDFAHPEALGLRAFFIDHHHQGKGYAKRAVLALKAFLLSAYPGFDQIYLTVNCKNPAARHCYQQGGFIDTHELYLGGAAGPQHIMRMVL
ncbi:MULTISPECIES: GNAT family N-acetyltransferase [unclassified Photobacterium]|uniref:GNAT family N-acetyltransferase n=1 Tax=unclassified Photobacterium TaxID=2628852 RepID=UPI003FA6E0C9